jgi:hypothetical protein
MDLFVESATGLIQMPLQTFGAWPMNVLALYDDYVNPMVAPRFALVVCINMAVSTYIELLLASH